jgi:hypothetical protein
MASGGMGRRRPITFEVTARAGLRGDGSAQFGLSGPATAGLGPAHPPEATMRFYSQPHAYYCGIDLHTRTLSLCLLEAAGAIRLDATLPPDRQVLSVLGSPISAAQSGRRC